MQLTDKQCHLLSLDIIETHETINLSAMPISPSSPSFEKKAWFVGFLIEQCPQGRPSQMLAVLALGKIYELGQLHLITQDGGHPDWNSRVRPWLEKRDFEAVFDSRLFSSVARASLMNLLSCTAFYSTLNSQEQRQGQGQGICSGIYVKCQR